MIEAIFTEDSFVIEPTHHLGLLDPNLLDLRWSRRGQESEAPVMTTGPRTKTICNHRRIPSSVTERPDDAYGYRGRQLGARPVGGRSARKEDR